MTVDFQLAGQRFVALNGRPQFTSTPAMSFVVNCESQKEIDRYGHKLSEGGKPNQCDWLQDRYGLSWQIVPTAMGKMMTDKNPKKSQAVMKAMLQMKKIELGELKHAYERA